MRKAGTRIITTLVLAGAIAAPAFAQEISLAETDKLRLLYFDPTETYLVPRIIQTMAFCANTGSTSMNSPAAIASRIMDSRASTNRP